LLIAAKDLRQRLRDRSALLVAVAVPLALALIFGFALRNVDEGRVTFDLAVADLDRGAVARAFVGDVLGRVERQGLVQLEQVASEEEARRAADRGRVAAAFVLPPGFSQAVESGRAARLTVVGDVDQPIGTLVARSLAESFAAEVDAVRVAVATSLRAGSKDDRQQLAEQAGELEPPVSIEDVSAERRQLDLTTFYSAGMAVFFLFFTVQLGVSTLLDERREGTLARLLAAPVRRGSILVGKVLTSFVLGVVSMTVLAVTTSLVVGAEWGDPLGVGMLVVAGVLSATAVTAVVATLARTADQAGVWQSIIAVVLGMLGGAFFPVGRSGGVVEALSLLTPHQWFLRGLTEMTAGGDATDALPAVGAILAFTAVVGGVALLRSRKLLER
jgi:ABC-2 type transport system permease protein